MQGSVGPQESAKRGLRESHKESSQDAFCQIERDHLVSDQHSPFQHRLGYGQAIDHGAL